jgi:thymidylate synthase (FAD)|tara:strand:+ start:1132 stop:1815 length:684 start_codon:yes stop_codon:yes gene_type:complete
MKVNLISFSQAPQAYDTPETLLDLVAYCARVSNPSNQNNTATNDKLVNYLIKHKHWSPLEMVSVCLEVETTRDIARQFLRHRSFSFQEFSQRYADPVKDLELITREARLQDPKNRQSSIAIDKTDEAQRRINEDFRMKQMELIHKSKEVYNWAISKGIAKEQARVVLPEGNTVSRLYANGTLRSWIHYIELRSGNGTQLEHQELAIAIAHAIAKIFPLANEYITEEL